MNLWLIPFFPLIGFLLNGLLGKRLSKALINAIALGSVAISFIYVVVLLLKLYPLNTPFAEHYFNWIQSGFLQIGFDLFVDRLTAVMLLVVTGVGLLIHIYAAGYMEHEGGYYRFFSYFNLFMFFMLLLVLASNLLLMFVGWEGVGLCSYLLVGFYFPETFASNAANKAFIVNRIGDFGFSLGIFLTVIAFKTLDFGKIAAGVSTMPVETTVGAVTAITLLLFVGATGKSAQLPLYVWLTGCDGRSHSGIRAHPCGDDGHGRCLHGGASLVPLRSRSARYECGCGDWSADCGIRRNHRDHAERYQARVCVFHRVAARLHVSGRWTRRVFCGHLSSDDARLF